MVLADTYSRTLKSPQGRPSNLSAGGVARQQPSRFSAFLSAWRSSEREPDGAVSGESNRCQQGPGAS